MNLTSSSQNQLLPWEIPGWNAEVEEWVRDTLLAQEISLTGPIQEAQRRPWSVILRVPTSNGDYYCKVCSPVLRHEPDLTKALAGWMPQVILGVVGVQERLGVILMPDGGMTLRNRFAEGADISLWIPVLRTFAQMQIDMVEHQSALLELGIIDRRLSILPGLFEGLISDLPSLRIGRKDGLTAEEFERIKAEVPVFRDLCAKLSGYGIPETLEHDDFHDGNIFYSEGRVVFYDWGESCLAHPFFSMVVGLNSISYRFNLKPGDVQWNNLRDAYLAPWEERFERAALLEAFALAMQLGAVNRALTWHRVVNSLPRRWKRQNADAVPGWLKEYLERRARSSAANLR